jgi:hypothetical protein
MLPSRSVRLLLITVCALLPVGCGLHGEATDPAVAGNAPPPGVPTGTFLVQLSAASFGGGELREVAGLNVTVSGVTAYPAEGGSAVPQVSALGPTPLLGGPVGFDLFSLQGSSMTLASGPVPAADYNRVRLEFTQASIVLRNGETNNLQVESGTVDLPLNVQVNPNETAFVALSINVQESVRLNRNNQGSFQPRVQVR